MIHIEYHFLLLLHNVPGLFFFGQIAEQLFESKSTVGNEALLLLGASRHTEPRGGIRNEDGIEAKARAAALAKTDATGTSSAEGEHCAINYDSKTTFESGLALLGRQSLLAVKFVEQFIHSVSKIAVTITGRVYAGRTIQSLNLHTGVIGYAVLVILVPYETGLLESIFLVRIARLRYIHLIRHGHNGQIYTPFLCKAITYLLGLADLSGIAGCKNQFHTTQRYGFFTNFAP